MYLTDKLTNAARDRMPHLQCLAFVRPCAESLRALCEELRQPRYRSYWLCTSPVRALTPDFSNVVPKTYIEALAEADQHQAVQAVQVRRRRPPRSPRNTAPTMSR